MTKDVNTKETHIVLKTYPVREEDKNPPFLLPGRWEIYPYTMMDDLSDSEIYRKYRAVILENEYLKVMIIPDLGGKIYSVYDKVSGRELFYKNSVVKTARIALRGAWVSGGVEFNFPNGHTVTTVSPVDYYVLKHKDGSATVFIGDTELVSRMRWCISITLRPGLRRIEQRTFIYNPTDVRNRFWYWANAAVPATNGLRFETPAEWAYCMGKVVKLRTEERDLTWYRNWDHAVDLFSLGAHAEYVGWYLYDLDYGGVHVADRYLLKGKKFFTWGISGSGDMWTKHLTDYDGPYCEVQAGFLETQYEYELMEPHQAYVFDEYWYPISGLKGLLYANKDIALNVINGNEGVEIRINSVRTLPCRVEIVHEEGNIVIVKNIELTPDHVTIIKVDENIKKVLDKGATILIRDRRGRIIARVQLGRYATSIPQFEPRPKAATTLKGSPEELERAGIYFEQQKEIEKAEKAYKMALTKDPNYSQALKGLGILFYKKGKLDKARELLERAITRKKDYEAIYYLALIARDEGDIDLAERYFGELTRSRAYSHLGYYNLGVCALIKREYERSIEFFKEALKRETKDLKSLVLMAYALEKLGSRDKAKEYVLKAMTLDPLYPLAIYELYYITRESSEGKAVIERIKNLIRPPDRVLIKGRPWYEHLIEVAIDYANIGDYIRAIKVLEDVVAIIKERYGEEYLSPMIYYYMGYFYEKMGDLKNATECYEKGNKMNPDYVFPFRREDEEVLRRVITRVNSWKPHYYLGNLLFARYRYEEAIHEWEAALKIGSNYSVLYRNLGLAYWRLKYNLEKAIRYYEKAVALDPYNIRAYVELSILYEIKGVTSKRIQLLERAPEDVKRHDYILERLASAYLDAEMYKEALNILLSNRFRPWEGFYVVRNIYEDTIIAYASQLLKKGEPKGAIKILSMYFKYPENLGIGRPARPIFTRAYYYMSLAYEALGEKDKALEFLKRGIKENPNAFSEDYYYRALCLRRIGLKDEADDAFREMMSISMNRIERGWGDDLRNYYMLGLALLGLGIVKEARRAFKRAILDRIPRQPKARLGEILYSLAVLRRARWRYFGKLLA